MERRKKENRQQDPQEQKKRCSDDQTQKDRLLCMSSKTVSQTDQEKIPMLKK